MTTESIDVCAKTGMQWLICVLFIKFKEKQRLHMKIFGSWSKVQTENMAEVQKQINMKLSQAMCNLNLNIVLFWDEI